MEILYSMEYDIQNFFDTAYLVLKDFYHSPFVLVIKILVGIYLLVLFVDIVLMLILRNVSQHLRIGIKGMDIPLLSKRRIVKRLETIKKRFKTDNVSQYKVAIIEADALVEEVLGGIGYSGANMAEKLEEVGEAHLDDHLEALKGAHEIRNKVVHEQDFEINREMAIAVFGVYENFLNYLDFLE